MKILMKNPVIVPGFVFYTLKAKLLNITAQQYFSANSL